jgi:hypothetical protein
MIVVPPLAVTDAILTSTTIAEPHAPSNYAGGTTYGVGAFATDATLFDVYQSLQPGNVGNTPSSSPTWWQKIGVKEVAYAAGTTYGQYGYGAGLCLL